MRMILLIGLLGACGTSDPVAADFYGDWTAEVDSTTRDFHFAASDSAHAELAGTADIYVLSSYPTGTTPTEVQWGHFAVGQIALSGVGTTLALQTDVLAGTGAGQSFGNQILDWSGDSFTMTSTTSSTGELVFTRQ